MKIAYAPQTASPGLAEPVSGARVLAATIRKDLRIARRYLPNLVGRLVELAIRFLFFLLLSDVVAMQGEATVGRRLTGSDLFVFFQGGLLLVIFKDVALWTPLNAIRQDLYNGTLEYLYSNPCSRYAYYLGTVLSEVLIAQVVFLPLYVTFVVYSKASPVSMALVLLVCVAVFFTLSGMGVMIGLLGLMWRQVSSLAGILAIGLEMVAGAYIPVAAFPQAVQYVAYALPFTWAYDLIRYYSFNGEWVTLLPVPVEWGILLSFGAVFTGLSWYLLGLVERYAKRSGLHLL